MKKFNFRLEPLLNLKEQEEKNIQKELLKLKKKYNNLKEKLEQHKSDKLKWQKQLAEEQKSGINTKTLLKYRNYIEYLNNEIDEVLLEMDYWQEKIEECQNRLLEKLKEKKTLSKLKEKKYQEYWEKFLQEERKQGDEIATNNYNHQNDDPHGSTF